jgi:hypothetical protein
MAIAPHRPFQLGRAGKIVRGAQDAAIFPLQPELLVRL